MGVISGDLRKLKRQIKKLQQHKKRKDKKWNERKEILLIIAKKKLKMLQKEAKDDGPGPDLVPKYFILKVVPEYDVYPREVIGTVREKYLKAIYLKAAPGDTIYKEIFKRFVKKHKGIEYIPKG